MRILVRHTLRQNPSSVTGCMHARAKPAARYTGYTSWHGKLQATRRGRCKGNAWWVIVSLYTQHECPVPTAHHRPTDRSGPVCRSCPATATATACDATRGHVTRTWDGKWHACMPRREALWGELRKATGQPVLLQHQPVFVATQHSTHHTTRATHAGRVPEWWVIGHMHACTAQAGWLPVAACVSIYAALLPRFGLPSSCSGSTAPVGDGLFSSWNILRKVIVALFVVI
jgi:hypothetical protein